MTQQEIRESAVRERKQDVSLYREALRAMAERAGAAGDDTQAGKLVELAEKLEQGDLTIAFCGHFSAGKSTLVNALIGAPLLPSSPIPTTANVVTVRSGEPLAQVTFRPKDGSEAKTEELPVERLSDLAIDGEGVAAIDVSYPVPLLEGRTALVDTPGVDSTDGAHRAATESALHLADVVFYVTDYNHVLSEVNFRFLRTLHRWGKPTYVIVNMIDKHREQEVSFAKFKEGLRQAMANWRIEPAGLLFLSLREPDHPLSQMEDLIGVIEALKPLREELLLRSAERSARYLAEQYREFWRQRHAAQREELAEAAGGPEEAGRLAEERERLEGELEAARSEGVRRLEAFRGRVDHLLANAGVTPAETRERVRAVLESLQPNFKAGGWFGGAAKTEAERERRIAELERDLNEQLAAHVRSHVLTMLREEAKEAGLEGQALEAELEQAFPSVTAEWIRQRVKPGTGADGQATLHFAAELAAEMKSAVRREALRLAEAYEARLAPERQASVEAAGAALQALEAREAAARGLAALDAMELAEEQRLLELLPQTASWRQEAPLPAPHERALGAAEAGLAEPHSQRHGGVTAAPAGGAAHTVSTAANTTSLAAGHHAAASAGTVAAATNGIAGASNTAAAANTAATETAAFTAAEGSAASTSAGISPLGAQTRAAERLERAAELLQPIAPLRKQTDGLLAKAARLRESRFTIALFGAFSAGKSSFANSLVGLPALPVSPNPTTATINRIVAPTEQCRHGSALIRMKTREELREDVKLSLGRLGVPAESVQRAGEDIAALLRLAESMSPDELHPKGRPHLAFIQAAAAGWPRYGELLGRELIADKADYRRYVAEEEASCFVASADLHIDSPLTRAGAVLVDTPGADSINARHTGVAFQYIKDADAVLFVTYYNHAFTEADRRFLNQLGSVKDVFELDKMFFVINAADLASSEEELASVVTHVETQLLKHGIRRPRLFPVSSLRGLEAKLAAAAGHQAEASVKLGASGLMAFEKAFRSFSEGELGSLAVAAANRELERIEAQLHHMLQAANEDAATRQERKKRMLESAAALRDRLSSSLNDTAVQPLLQELGEQFYHSRQRVRYRFNELFMLAFHPSVLQDDGRDLKKLLQACWQDLRRSVGEDLQQELRAASLRMEHALHRLVEGRLADEISGAWLEGFEPEPQQKPELPLPVGEPFDRGPEVETRKLWSAFRSPKHFFERDGKNALRDELETELFHAADDWLAVIRAEWSQAIADAFRSELNRAGESLASELAAYAAGLEETIYQPGEEHLIEQLAGQLTNLRNGINS
ncbi:dynamin family protein [Cohnella lubricantis]|uniref:Dynamin family protein n=1 Tax=Cohnella lubricantis TaxID=2163172 RepID=A0A841TC35_9BACL|nr:dynamin family protein [Cohnella lubricantis]MBB6676567.1 dynamin family protein [Cohnella lubricantis]MBP2117422.1 GTPase Era involved in 16S rRNA processing [Cohnella lubricantis]